MDTQPCGRDDAFARDLEQRERADIPAPTVGLVAGLVAGMRLVGRPQ